MWLLTLRGSSGRAVTVLLGGALVVAQGNAWVQVVSCRINRAFGDAMRSRATALKGSSQVLVDLKSFTRRIPSTWVPVEFDLLNTYYGAETFEDWGLILMVRLASGDPQTPVTVAVTSPILAKGELRFVKGYATGGRGFLSRAISIPAQGATVVGFTEVFGAAFEDGLGRPVADRRD